MWIITFTLILQMGLTFCLMFFTVFDNIIVSYLLNLLKQEFDFFSKTSNKIKRIL